MNNNEKQIEKNIKLNQKRTMEPFLLKKTNKKYQKNVKKSQNISKFL